MVYCRPGVPAKQARFYPAAGRIRYVLVIAEHFFANAPNQNAPNQNAPSQNVLGRAAGGSAPSRDRAKKAGSERLINHVNLQHKPEKSTIGRCGVE
jgi:hypothetical protein